MPTTTRYTPTATLIGAVIVHLLPRDWAPWKLLSWWREQAACHGRSRMISSSCRSPDRPAPGRIAGESAKSRPSRVVAAVPPSDGVSRESQRELEAARPQRRDPVDPQRCGARAAAPGARPAGADDPPASRDGHGQGPTRPPP